MPYAPGEEIRYKIKKLGMTAGEALLNYQGLTQVDGQDAILIIFTVNGMNFYDEEKIYMDPETYLPIQVRRDLNIWGKKELIIEYYDAQAGHVKIVKTVKGEMTEQYIEKEGRLDNIYSFIYRYRRDGSFEKGDMLQINLPTMDVSIELVNKQKLNAAGSKRDAFFMESNPKKYRVWFDDSLHKVPLRIDGAISFGSTSLIMTEYRHTDSEIAAHSEENEVWN